MRQTPNSSKLPNTEKQSFVSASVVAERYNVSSRYILKLAEEGRIPSLRIGKKCVRFCLEAVSAVLEERD
ncbi:helix-turn-helix domain-containing protein [Roseibacillus persicicus]|uniref:helix-turn-helix transcriptional regulator n=1 Tax=Roseibacillus persicicus TaxID=454148 RepID=UPI00398A5570